MLRRLRRYLVTGVLVLLPVAVSIWILWRLGLFFEGILGNFLKAHFPYLYAPGLGIVSIFIIILLVGIFSTNFLGRRLVKWGEGLLTRIPIFNKVYIFIKGIIDGILRDRKTLFQGVVLVEFPQKGSWTIGFVTGKSFLIKEGEELTSIFVPTTPNITTGFYLLLPAEKIEKLDLSIEEGMKLVVSMGIATPPSGKSQLFKSQIPNNK